MGWRKRHEERAEDIDGNEKLKETNSAGIISGVTTEYSPKASIFIFTIKIKIKFLLVLVEPSSGCHICASAD